MTDRHRGYIVVLASDIREDDAQPTLDAIKQIRGVIGVEPMVASPMDFVADMRAKNDVKQKFIDFWKSL